MCIVFSWLKNAVLLKQMCRSELWFSRNGFGHSCRAVAGRNYEKCRRGRRNVIAVCRPSTPYAHRRGLVQPPWAYLRPSGSLRRVTASACLHDPFDWPPQRTPQRTEDRALWSPELWLTQTCVLVMDYIRPFKFITETLSNGYV